MFGKRFKLSSCLGLVLIVKDVVGRRPEIVFALVPRMLLQVGLLVAGFVQRVVVLGEGKVVLGH